MSLADELQKLEESTSRSQASHEQVDYPSSHLKHYPIMANKKNPQLRVRILPAVSPEAPFWAQFRSLWVRNDNNKAQSYIIDAEPEHEDPLLQAVQRWSRAEYTDEKGETKSGLYKLDPVYGAFPSLTYYLNVVPLEIVKDSKGVPRYAEKTIEDPDTGAKKLDIYIMSINTELINTLATQLKDPMKNPNYTHPDWVEKYKANGYSFTDDDMKSFISSAFSYPVTVDYVKGRKPARILSIDTNDAHILKPLPRDWQNQAEDLVYQTTPSYKINPSWITTLINKYDAELGLTSHVEAPKQQPVQPAPVQPKPQQPAPSPSNDFDSPILDTPAPQADNSVSVSGGNVATDMFPDLNNIAQTEPTNNPAPSSSPAQGTDNTASLDSAIDDIIGDVDLSGLDDDEKGLFEN